MVRILKVFCPVPLLASYKTENQPATEDMGTGHNMNSEGIRKVGKEIRDNKINAVSMNKSIRLTQQSAE